VCANDFCEWTLGSTYFLTNPEVYPAYVAGDRSKFEHSCVTEYVYSPAVDVDPAKKVVVLGSGREVSYDYLVVCSGYRLPLLHAPSTGIDLSARKSEIERWGAAIRAENATVVINGAGAIGLELVGDVRVANPSARVILVSRSGSLGSSGASKEQQAEYLAKLTELKVEVLQGKILHETCSGERYGNQPLGTSGSDSPPGMCPMLGGGSIEMASGNIKFDVFLPAFYQGPNTQFLRGEWKDQGTSNVKTNEYLQCCAASEVFAIGLNSTGEGFVAPKIEAQCATVLTNIQNLSAMKPLQKHKPFEPKMDLNAQPMVTKIGNKDGYLFFENLPACGSCCVRLCGFPFALPCCLAAKCDIQACFLCGFCGCKPDPATSQKAYLKIMGVAGIKHAPNLMGGPFYAQFGTAPPLQQSM